MKNTVLIRLCFSVLVCCGIAVGCSKMNDSYEKFIKHGEQIYSANPDSIWIASGRNRVQLSWLMKGAPHVDRYCIYWNDGLDSSAGSIADILNGDTARIIIDDLSEGSYAFKIFTFDKGGNASIGKDTLAEVYGAGYAESLSNRPLKSFALTGSDLKLIWYPADSSNINTELRYMDQSGTMHTVRLPADSQYNVLEHWEIGSKIYYKSAFIPAKNAIDTFEVEHYDSVRVTNIPVSKALWKAVSLPHDAGERSEANGLSWLWDGQPADYPDIYYASEVPPCAFTIDLGQVYTQLTRMEEWGRAGGYYNPLHFEVWGIADTTGAIVDLSPDETGWKEATQDKGWTLLADVERDDNGVDGWTADLIANPPAVRFIRIRVLTTATTTNKMHLSELSFWYNP